jgi:hypothetical protein
MGNCIAALHIRFLAFGVWLWRKSTGYDQIDLFSALSADLCARSTVGNRAF